MSKQRLLAVVLLSFFAAPSSIAVDKVTIGTGSTAGVYYQVGRAICRLLQSSGEELACEALASDGSIANLEALKNGEINLGIVQSDWQYHAYQGSARFAETGADQSLRSLFSVHGEPFTVVARADAKISSFADLAGKRVNIGNPGSGQRATMETVMAAFGWDKSTFSLANELPASQQSLALCHDRVQAMVYTVGHPNESVEQATSLCGAKLVEVSGAAIDKLVADNPFYAHTEIPGGLYSENPDVVNTFGVKATVVSSAEVDAETIYTIVKTVFNQLDTFKQMHPAFTNLIPEAMIKDGLSAPLHEGAQRYYQEQGLSASN